MHASHVRRMMSVDSGRRIGDCDSRFLKDSPGFIVKVQVWVGCSGSCLSAAAQQPQPQQQQQQHHLDRDTRGAMESVADAEMSRLGVVRDAKGL